MQYKLLLSASLKNREAVQTIYAVSLLKILEIGKFQYLLVSAP